MSALVKEFKYGVIMTPLDDIHLDDCDFDIETYVYTNKSVTYHKGDENHLKPIDKDSYKVIVNSEDSVKIGKGRVMTKVTVKIPDADFEDGYRTEICNLWTGITIP